MNKKGLVWFTTDLRVSNNAALTKAVLENDEVLPLFIIDPNWCASSIYGFRKTGAFRLQFIYESVLDLQKNLHSKGAELLIVEGDPLKIIPELCLKYKISSVYAKHEFGCDEQAVQQDLEHICKSLNVDVNFGHTHSLLDFSKLPFAINNLPIRFDEFCEAVKNCATLPLVEAPASISCVDVATGLQPDYLLRFQKRSQSAQRLNVQQGGETAAQERLHNFIWNDKQIEYYSQDTANGPSISYTSKLSAYLAQGCISASYIKYEVEKYCSVHSQLDGGAKLIKALLWRDYMYLSFQRYGLKFFRQGGVYNKALACIPDMPSLASWINCHTASEYVNACMTELKTTGYIGFTRRQHVVNFLSKELLVDWRIGAAYFESILIDYDICLNYGNWARMVGVGSNPAEDGAKLDYAELAHEFDYNQAYSNIWLSA